MTEENKVPLALTGELKKKLQAQLTLGVQDEYTML
jgi:hypothetical protein